MIKTNTKMEIFLLLINHTLILIADLTNNQDRKTMAADIFRGETAQVQKKTKQP